MILAAGIGSRLKPLTQTRPKALLTFREKTMLEHVISQISQYGIKEVLINIHHHADQIVEFLRQNNNFGMKIEFSDERELLMDTGGGILKAEWFFKDHGPFLVHNIDIYSDINLTDFYSAHMRNGSLATLAVKERKTSRNLLIDSEHLLCGWRNNLTGETIIVNEKPDLQGIAFSGLHIIDPKIFAVLERTDPFSMISAYLDIAGQHRIMTFDHSEGAWIDMAHPSNFPGLA